MASVLLLTFLSVFQKIQVKCAHTPCSFAFLKPFSNKNMAREFTSHTARHGVELGVFGLSSRREVRGGQGGSPWFTVLFKQMYL